MRSEEYKRYMRSKEWERKRQQRLAVDENCCVMCGRPADKCKSGLQVHHLSYRKPLGQESVADDLVTLCPACHIKIHKLYNRRREVV